MLSTGVTSGSGVSVRATRRESGALVSAKPQLPVSSVCLQNKPISHAKNHLTSSFSLVFHKYVSLWNLALVSFNKNLGLVVQKNRERQQWHQSSRFSQNNGLKHNVILAGRRRPLHLTFFPLQNGCEEGS